MLSGQINYVDIVIVVLLALQIVRGVRQGVWAVLARLVSFLGGILVAFWGYQTVGAFVLGYFDLVPPLSYALSFVGLFVLIQALIHAVMSGTGSFFPELWHRSHLSRALAVVPAAADALILVSFLLLLSIVLPIPSRVRADITGSQAGSAIIGAMQSAEQYAQRITDGALDRAFTFFTVRTETDESVHIPYKPNSLSVDEETERQMLVLINIERAKVGAPPLVIDGTLREIARAHSRDMWERHYFAHINPDGDDPFDRMGNGGARFILAGENLAYAASVSLAHRGLMNSPGHRRNILQPRFNRVGIGVVDGGIYGKMFTQNFAD